MVLKNLWCSLDISPAAADTIEKFLKDTESEAKDYDYIFTGDLGKVGSSIDGLIKNTFRKIWIVK